MKTKIVNVTPAIAAKWLENQAERQRPLRDRVVAKYAADMTSGHWRSNHQGVAFGMKGQLLDGQHRLSAIIRSGVTVEMSVTTEVEDEAFVTIDQGAARSIGHMIGRSNQWVAMVTHLYRLQRNVHTHTGVTVAIVEETYKNARKELDACGEFIAARLVPGTTAAVMAYAFPLDPDRVQEFGEQIREGLMLKPGDPALTWRRWFGAHGAQERSDISFATCNALAAALQGERLSKLYVGPAGYRWITTKRRADKIRPTPSAQEVDSYSGGK